MKVLHLISSGGLFGAERVVLNLARQNNGVISWIGALNNQHNPHLEILFEAKNLGIKTMLFNSKGKVDFKTISYIRHFLKENKIDILHTHNYKSDIVGFLATRFNKTSWVSTNHLWHSSDSKMRFYEAIDAVVLKFAKMIFAVSQEIKDDLLTKGFKDSNLHVIPNGITISQFSQSSGSRQQIRTSWNVSDHEILIGIIGRLASEKGHEILFKALVQIVSNQVPVKCVVVGDGPLKSDLETLVKNLNLSNYVIWGGIRKDIPAVYSACDIMVNASFMEGLPMVILEAMASRLPIIATKVGGVPQVIRDHKNGILLEPGNSDTLAQAITELANNASQRQALATEAYKDVCEHFSDVRMAQDYRNFYQKVLQSK